jgi:hypothetical protein
MTDYVTLGLAGIRADIPAPNAAATDIAYASLMEALESPARRRRRGLGTRSRAVLAIGVAILVLVPTALAFGGKIVDAFTGSAPTPTVTERYSLFNSMSEFANSDAVKTGFSQALPHVDVSKAHGVVQVQTADGPEQLWTAPASDGSKCLLAIFANDSTSGQMWCDNGNHVSRVTFSWEANADHPNLMTGIGYVYVPATAVTLTLADGSQVAAPVIEGAYLVSLPNGAAVTHVAAQDASGKEVASYDPPTAPSQVRP